MQRLRRTFMITPIFEPEKLEKAARSDVDVVMLDLEDGVHPSRKEEARHRVAEVLRTLDWRGKDVVVRVNPTREEVGLEDVRVVGPAAPAAIVLAKCDDADEPQAADRLLGEIARSRPAAQATRLWCFVESAKGLFNVERIAFSCERMEALVLGTGDLSADMGLNVRRITLSGEEGVRDEYLYAQGRVVATCRAAGISPTSGVPVRTKDVEGAFVEAARMYRLGFDTLGIVTPRVCQTVHDAYRPSQDDIAWARETLAAQRAADDEAGMYGTVDGAMVDGPHFRGARQILARLEAIERVERERALRRAREVAAAAARD